MSRSRDLPGLPAQVDLGAMARDDELLDHLGARADVPDAGPVAVLLRALSLDVDDGLPELLASLSEASEIPELTELTELAELAELAELPASAEADQLDVPDDAREAVVAPVAPAARRRSARVLVAAVVVGTTVSISGVSAAVTGDPLGAYHSVARALGVEADLPPTAAEVAQANRLLARATKAVRADDPRAAQLLAELESRLADEDLPAGRRAALAKRLASLRAELAGERHQPSSQRSDPPGQAGQGNERNQDAKRGQGDDARGTGGNAREKGDEPSGNGGSNRDPDAEHEQPQQDGQDDSSTGSRGSSDRPQGSTARGRSGSHSRR